MADPNQTLIPTPTQQLTSLGQSPDAPGMTPMPAVDEAAEARQARETAGRVQRRRAEPPAPSTPVARQVRDVTGDENIYDQFLTGPQGDGPELLERARLNAVDAHYRGTLLGSTGLAALAHTASLADDPTATPEMKVARLEAKRRYDEIVLDLLAYDMMPQWNGLPQFGAALGGVLAGSMTSPESFLGAASQGTTWAWRTFKAGRQQAGIAAASDPLIQAANMGAGVQEGFEYERLLTAPLTGFAVGGTIHGTMEGVGRGVDALINQHQARKILYDLGQQDFAFSSPDMARWALDPANGIEAPPRGRGPAEDLEAIRDRIAETHKPERAAESFDDKVKSTKERLVDSYGAAQPKGKRLNEEARWGAFQEEVGDQLDGVLENYGLDRQSAHDIYKLYDRGPDESPGEALHRAVDKWGEEAERKALQSLANDSEWLRDMEVLEQHFNAIADSPLPEFVGRMLDDHGRIRWTQEPVRLPGGRPDAPRTRVDTEPPFEPGEAPGGGGGDRAGGGPTDRPSEAQGAPGEREGGAGVGRPAGERPAGEGAEGPPGGAADRGVARPAGLPADAPVRLYQGSGRADVSTAYNGTDFPVAGPGQYFSFSQEHAKSFGPNMREVTVDQLGKPLVITDGEQWRLLTKEAGWDTPNPYGASKDQMVEMTARLQDVVRRRGYDGMIAWWDNASPYDIDPKTGANMKLLRAVFGEPQGVVFGPPRGLRDMEPTTDGRLRPDDLQRLASLANQVEAARARMPDDVRADFDMLVAMGANRGNAASKDAARYEALIKEYAPPAEGGKRVEGRSAEYQEVADRTSAASREFAEAQRRYRAREIGDDEFLAAKAKHDAAQREFDAAYEKEEARIQAEDPYKTEATAQGEQTLIPGVEPVTDRERIQSQADKPMRGGNRPPPDGGLFDLDSQAQQDIFDSQVAGLLQNRRAPTAGEVRRPDQGVASVPGRDLSAREEIAIRSMQQQAQDLADAIGFPLRQGRMTLKKAQGEFHWTTGVVRMKEVADFVIVAHEAGHAIESKVGRAVLRPMQQRFDYELVPLDYDFPKQQRLEEGFAEWMRLRINNPNQARAVAPSWTNAFEAFMDRDHPEIMTAIRNAAAANEAWIQASGVDAIAALTRYSKEKRGGVMGSLDALKEAREEGGMGNAITTVLNLSYQATTRTYDAIFNAQEPINRAVRDMLRHAKERTGRLQNLPEYRDPAVLMRAYRMTGQAALVQTQHGIVPRGSLTPEWPGVEHGVTEAIGASSNWGRWNEAKVQSFDNYLVARMGLYLWEKARAGEIPKLRGDPVPFNMGDARQAVAEYETAFPTFKRAGDMIHQFTRNLLKKQFDSGLITPDQYAKLLEYDFYVPLNREMGQQLADRAGGGGGPMTGETLSSAPKTRRGSERDILSPLESIKMAVFHVEHDIRMNDIRLALRDIGRRAGPEGGQYIEELPAYEARKYEADLELMIENRAKELGVPKGDVDLLLNVLRDQQDPDAPIIGSFFKMEQAATRGEPIVFVWEGGVPKPIRLMSRKTGGVHPLYEVMTAAPAAFKDLWVQLATIPANVIRTTVVMEPGFIIQNFIRDQLQAGMMFPGYIPFISGLRGIKHELTQDRIAFLRAYLGGESVGSMAGVIEREYTRDVQDMTRDGWVVQRVAGVRAFLEATQVTEAATRHSIFARVFEAKQKQGLSELESGWAASNTASDIMPWSRHGNMMRVVQNAIPFFGPWLQGIDRVFIRGIFDPIQRRIRRDQVLTRDIEEYQRALYAVGVTSATVAFGAMWAAINWEDQGYRDARPAVKAMNLLTYKNGVLWAMPKPFDLGVGATIGEYAYAGLYQQDPRAARMLREALIEQLSPPDPTRIAGVTLRTELQTNTSLFTGAPIVPERYQGLPPEQQYSERTSALGKYLGRVTGWSPMKIDYALGSAFATWGRNAMIMSNWVDEDAPTAAMDDWLIVRRWAKDPQKVTEVASMFWQYMSHKNGKYAMDANGYKMLVHEATIRGQPITQATEFLNKLPAPERAYVILREAAAPNGKQAFDTTARMMHPLERAQKASEILAGVARDLGSNMLVPYRENERLTLDPVMRRNLIDKVRTLAGVELRNAFAITEEPGYKGRPVYDVNDLMVEINALSPSVAKEIAQRYANDKILTTKAVQGAWTQLRDEVIRYGSTANILPLEAQAKAQGYEFGELHRPRARPFRAPIAPGQVPATTP